MKKVLLVVLLLAVAAVVVYFFVLRKPSEAPPTTGAIPGPRTIKPKEPTEVQKRKRAEKMFDQLRKYADRNRDDLIGIESRVKDIEDLAGKGSAIATKAHRVYNTAKSRYDEAACRAYEDLAGEVREKLEEKRARDGTPDSKQTDYEVLFKLFNKFPARYLTAEYSAKLFELKEPINEAIAACRAYEKVRFPASTAANEKRFKDAVEELKKFPEQFKKSEWEPERQKLLAKYTAQLTRRRDLKKKEESLTYYDLYHGQALDKSDWSDEEGVWKVRNGVLIGEPGRGEERVLAYSGGNDWVDLTLRIRMRLVRGSITIAVRGTEKREGFLTYDPIRLAVGDLDANRWYTLSVRLRGDKYTVTGDPELPHTQEWTGEKERGPVAIWVKSSSELHIKSIKIGFFDKVPASFAEEAGRQQADGRAKKLGESEEENSEDD